MSADNITKEEVQRWVKEAVADSVETPPHCAAKGLTTEEVITLQKFIRALDTTSKTIGRTVVIFIVTSILGLLTYGFWDKVGK